VLGFDERMAVRTASSPPPIATARTGSASPANGAPDDASAMPVDMLDAGAPSSSPSRAAPPLPASTVAFDYSALASEKPASIADVMSGKVQLDEGSTGDAVKAIQQVLHIEQTGVLGPTTAKAIEAFKNAKHITTPAGLDASTVGKTTMGALMQNYVSPAAQKQMDGLLAIAQKDSASDDGAPWGHCYGAVWGYLQKAAQNGGIGNNGIANANPPSSFAAQFGEWMNEGDNAKSVGMKRLDIKNPYDAPPGAVVVVAAGSPGTSSHDSHGDSYATDNGVSVADWNAHPDWPGDISIATGDGVNFVNDHNDESYGGSRAAWEKAAAAGNAKLIGAYVPAE
jgi:hypothetical protein